MSEEEKPMTFKEMWEYGGEYDPKSWAEQFLKYARQQKWPEELIHAIMGLFATVKGYDDSYQETFATKESDVNPLAKKLSGHKHLPTGEAVEQI